MGEIIKLFVYLQLLLSLTAINPPSHSMSLLDAFYRTHAYLIQHTPAGVRRMLMDEIDWNDRLIGIKGTRGVGKTTFLLQYAKEKFPLDDRQCLYINMNNFYFQGRGITAFAGEFVKQGGRVLLIDQVFKDHNWSQELRQCYDSYPQLKIVFTGSSVMRLKEENPEIGKIVKSYNLRGFSFREFINIKTGLQLPAYTLEEILLRNGEIQREILSRVSPKQYFQDYLHHGFYPFFQEQRNYSENLLKTMNMITEVDILLIKQIELKYLPKIKKLFYLLACNASKTPNISILAREIQTSRATVMKYIKYLADARLINILYRNEETLHKKPARVMLHNTNLMYAIYPIQVKQQEVMQTFMLNALWDKNTVNSTEKPDTFVLNKDRRLIIYDALGSKQPTQKEDNIYIRYNTEIGRNNHIPLWLLGFLY